MDFLTSIKTCFQKFSDFNGRASRSEFWYFYLFVILAYIFIFVLSILVEFFFVIFFIFVLIVLVPTLAVTARRLHDIGKSGWWQILAYIPYVGILFSIILIVFWCQEGEKKKNNYGKPIKLKR